MFVNEGQAVGPGVLQTCYKSLRKKLNYVCIIMQLHKKLVCSVLLDFFCMCMLDSFAMFCECTYQLTVIHWGIMINQKHKKNKNEHIDEILGEIQHRIMMEIWSIIPTGLMKDEGGGGHVRAPLWIFHLH